MNEHKESGIYRGDERRTTVGSDVIRDTLTKREHFAARAMQGLLSNSSESLVGLTAAATAEIAVEHAEALMAALNGIPSEAAPLNDKTDDEFSNRALE